MTDETFEKQAEVDLRFVIEECAQRIASTKKEVQEIQDRQIAASLHDIEEESEKLCETEDQKFHMADGMPIEESDEEQEPFKMEISAKKPKNLLATFQKVAVDESHVKKVRWSESSHSLSKKESVKPVDEAEGMPPIMETIEEPDPKKKERSESIPLRFGSFLLLLPRRRKDPNRRGIDSCSTNKKDLGPKVHQALNGRFQTKNCKSVAPRSTRNVNTHHVAQPPRRNPVSRP